MADKEFLLGNRARELLKYTKQATRVVSGDISKADVRAIITRVAELDDICDVKMVCQEVVHVLDTKDKEGFTKSTFRMYGEDMRETAKKILTDIHRANNTNFVVAYEDRIHKIEEVVDGCSLLLEYITICMDEGIISVKKAGVWTKKVTDVKYMAMAWLKGDQSQQAPFGSEGKGGQKPLQSGDVRLLRSPVRTEVIRVHGGGIRLELGYDSHRPPTGGSAPRTPTTPTTCGTSTPMATTTTTTHPTRTASAPL